jgi:hypothetical protein
MRQLFGFFAIISVIGVVLYLAATDKPSADKEATSEADTEKAAVKKVMRDAIAARHAGVVPDKMSKEDSEIAAQAALKWKQKQTAEKTKHGLEGMKVKPPPSSGALEIYLAKQAITKMMRHPDSAMFGDVFFFNDRKTATGYYVPVVCGTVNGRNGFGGMTGQKRFVAVMSDIANGVWLEGATPPDTVTTEWNRFCAGRHD